MTAMVRLGTSESRFAGARPVVPPPIITMSTCVGCAVARVGINMIQKNMVMAGQYGRFRYHNGECGVYG
jgi:hypothetical protein